MKLVLALVALVFAVLSSSPSFAANRVALVIGNDTYLHLRAGNQLERAGTDAAAVGDALESIGFKVLRGHNLAQLQMLQMIRQLREAVRPGDIALVFYAGHGVAIQGTNYLLPTDIRPSTESRIAESAIPETQIEQDLLGAGARTGILILDACRNNPFPPTARSIGRSRGLASSRETPGIFKMFSAGTGQLAIETLGTGDDDPNSLFTRVLLGELVKPEQSLIDLTYAVKGRVLDLSGGRQSPAYYDGGFANDVYLAGRADPVVAAAPPPPAQPVPPAPPVQVAPPVPPAPAAPAAPATAPEPPQLACTGASEHFAVAQRLGTRAALEAHLGFYGQCPYAPFAQSLLDGMGAAASPQALLAAPPEVEGAARVARARKAVSDCDRLAASDADRRRGIRGVAFSAIDTARAIPACEAAVAARPDDARLQYQFGRALEASGTRPDDVAAAYRRSADLGFALAQLSLGSLHAAGKGVPRDYAEAVTLFRKAAEHELPAAENALAGMYERGLGVPPDVTAALIWYERAAANGHLAAHGNAARILTGNVFGKTTHYARAADHWRTAAAAGDTDAALKLAVAIRDGQVAPRSGEEMMESFDAAARTGRADALLALAEIHLDRRHFRDALDLAYRAYDVASAADIASENGWPPLQFLSASLIVKVVRQARTLPRSHREYETFRRDFAGAGFRRFTVPATCAGSKIAFSVYAWDWSRDTDMVTPQLEWLEKARGCSVPGGIAASFRSAFELARDRNVGYGDLIATTLRDARKMPAGDTVDMARDTP